MGYSVLQMSCPLQQTNCSTSYSPLGFVTGANNGTFENLTSGRLYWFSVSAVNLAGGGPGLNASQISMFLPSAPLNFTARVVGNLVVLLSWSIPSNTGLGPDNQREPIVAYKIFRDGAAGGFLESRAEIIYEGPELSWLITYSASRKQPFYYMIKASNLLGYGQGEAFQALADQQVVATPTSPQNLTAKVVGVRLVSLAWSPPNDTGVGDQSRALTTYILELALDQNFTSVVSNFSVPATASSWVVSVPGSGPLLYWFHLFAVNEASTSPASSPAAEQGVTLPGRPENLTARTDKESTVSLGWSLPFDTGINGSGRIILAYNITVVDAGVTIRSLVVVLSSVDISELSYLRVYTFKVFAINDAGQSQDFASIDVQPVTKPSAPLNVSAVVKEARQIIIIWNIPENTGQGGRQQGLTGYFLEMDNTTLNVPNASFVPVSEWSISCLSTQCSYSVNFSASRPEPYNFRLRAKNQVGLGVAAYANEQSIEVASPPLDPSAQVVGPHRIRISWLEPANTGVGDLSTSGLYNRMVINYVLHQSFGDINFGSVNVTVLSGSLRVIEVYLPIASATQYFFRVYAVNSAGSSLPSLTVSEQSIDLPSPSDVSVRMNGPLRMIVQWTLPINFGPGDQSRPLISFLLEIAEMQTQQLYNFSWLQQNISANTTSLPVTGFRKGLTYMFRVAAFNSAGQGMFQNVSKDAISLPSVVMNFSARVSNPFQIILGWSIPLDTGFFTSDIKRITSFLLQSSTDNNIWSDTVLSGYTLTYVAQNLTKGLNYFYRLWALNEAGSSVDSALNQEQSIDVPSPPLNFIAAIKAPLQFNFSWIAPNDTGRGVGIVLPRRLNTYKLQIFYSDYPPASTSANFTHIDIALDIEYTALFQILSNLTKGKSVFARIQASNDAGAGAYSNTALQTVVDIPTSPSLTNIISNQVMSISLQWLPPLDTGPGIGKPWSLTMYRLQIAKDLSFLNDTTNVTIAGTATSAVISPHMLSFVGGMRYYFRLIAVNVVGESVPSQVGAEHALEAPTQPQHLTVAVSTVQEVELIVTWDAPSDTGLLGQACFVSCSGPMKRTIWYVVERVTLEQSPDIVAAVSPQSQPTVDRSILFNQSLVTTFLLNDTRTTMRDSGLQKGYTYYYRIYAYNSAGQGTATSSVYEMAMSLPSVVQNVTLNWVVYQAGYLASLYVRWLPPLDNGNGLHPQYIRPLLFYRLQISESSTATLYSQLDLNINTFEFNATGLTKGKNYYFRLTAQNSAGQAIYSSWIQSTAISRPTPPNNPLPQVTNPGEITLYWETPSDTGTASQSWRITFFTVQIDLDSTFTNATSLTKSGSTSDAVSFDGSRYFHVQKGLMSVVIFFRVYATNEAGQSDASPTVSKMVIDLPSKPRLFSVSRSGPLSLTVRYTRPSFTGSTKILMPLSYILEMSLVNDSFVLSPFYDEDCYPGKYSVCTTSTKSPYDIGINGSSGIVFSPKCPKGIDYINSCTSWQQSFDDRFSNGSVILTGLIRGHTYYFRIFAANSAGLSVPTETVWNIAVGLPSEPRQVSLTLEGFLSFRIMWMIPSDTGIGDESWPIDLYGVQIQSDDQFILNSFGPGTSTVIEAGNVYTTVLVNGYRNVSIGASTAYYVRACAYNEVGQGDFSRVLDNRPHITSIFPTHGPAVGNTEVTLYGSRFGDQSSAVKIRIGSTECSEIAVVAYQEQVRCRTPSGSNGVHVLNVSVQGVVILDSIKYIYDNPAVGSVVPTAASVQGSQVLTILGRNFGAFDQSPQAVLESKFVQPCSSTSWLSDSSILCGVPKMSLRAAYNNTVVVLIGSTRSNRWAPGSTFVFKDIPRHFECPRQAAASCFHCVFEKCNLDLMERYMALNDLDAFRKSSMQFSCEAVGLEYCNFDSPPSNVEDAGHQMVTSIPQEQVETQLRNNRGSVCNEAIVSYELTHETRTVRTNACPDYSKKSVLNFDSEAPTSQDLVFLLPAKPIISKSSTPLTGQLRQGIIGMAVNGVPFYSSTDHSGMDLVTMNKASLDSCGGRVSHSGIYHYLLDPSCLYADSLDSHSPIVGLMLDGIPIYGRQDVGGRIPLDLDSCNGHVDKENSFYHYHITDKFPYTIGCFKGCIQHESLAGLNWELKSQPCQKTKTKYSYNKITCAVQKLNPKGQMLECSVQG